MPRGELPVIHETKKLLAEKIEKNRRRLWEWHQEHARLAPPPLYSSVDLRDSGHKVVPVDSNLFPAGFNNICPEDLRNAGPIFRHEIELQLKQLGRDIPKKILILPEFHTQNVYYIENLYYLRQILLEAGFIAEIGWRSSSLLPTDENITNEPINLISVTRKELTAYPMEINEGILSAHGFTPDLILMNNDFSSGYPSLLDTVTQPIIPSHSLGWHSRKKSEHFHFYNELAGEFAQIIDIDPWLVQIETEEVFPVNFNEEIGIEKTAETVARIIDKLQVEYRARNISHRPFVFIKNNAGTYGMGIMTAHSAEDLLHLNRRTKNKMSVGKNRMNIESIVVQEGIPTATLVNRLAAEPVIYLFGTQLIGGFLRTNTEKGVEDNLNSQGMVFRMLCMSDLRQADAELQDLENHHPETLTPEPILELVYGSIARISALAAGKELAQKIASKH
jgi:glutamate--cysteine ligase